MSTQTTSPTGMATPNQSQIQQCLMKVMYLGLGLTLGLPLVLLAVGYVVRRGGEVAQPPERIMLYALLAVAVSEIPAAIILRKVMLKPLSSTPGGIAPTTDYVFSRYLVISNLAAACSVYSLVWYLLGGTLPEFALFAVVGLVIFRLTRPSTEFFFSLFGVRPAIE